MAGDCVEMAGNSRRGRGNKCVLCLLSAIIIELCPIYVIFCIYTYVRTYIHTYIHTYTHTYIHTYIHTHIHTYIHTYIHTAACYHHGDMSHICHILICPIYVIFCIYTYVRICRHTYIHTYTLPPAIIMEICPIYVIFSYVPKKLAVGAGVTVF